MISFLKQTIQDDFKDMDPPSSPSTERRKERDQAIKDSKDFSYNGIYEILIVPFKFEKLVFWQCMLYVSTLIYNSVVLPIRVTLILIKALPRISKQKIFTVR